MKALTDLADRFENASKIYAEMNGIARNDDWFILKMRGEGGELTQAWEIGAGGRRTDPGSSPG